TMNIVPADYITTGFIHAKEAGVIAGLPVAEEVFRILNRDLSFQVLCRDGERVEAGRLLARVEGDARTILMGERLALNFLQRLSGIATKTAAMAAIIKNEKAQITDTRKTTPGLRVLEKYAVRVGGGYNHRFGLYDAVLIKDNHIKVAGGIAEAVKRVQNASFFCPRIEVEVETLEGLREALAAKADIIMLDNMDLDTMREAVKIANGQVLLEASGGVTEKTVLEIAKTGVDYISTGSLTHAVKSLDISLDVGEMKPLKGYVAAK
ncbi:MAG: carboxylating nicotinate-nucleotide diphosphorylase, partial [Clostridia bacterium]|nr:carboxylating nicotinate-nucleotide diphosphorylase [Clostridia bacterium]